MENNHSNTLLQFCGTNYQSMHTQQYILANSIIISQCGTVKTVIVPFDFRKTILSTLFSHVHFILLYVGEKPTGALESFFKHIPDTINIQFLNDNKEILHLDLNLKI